MKKTLVIALVLVLSLGTITLAAGWPDNNTVQDAFDVKVNILPYAFLEVPDYLDLGDINFFNGFNRTYEVEGNIKLYTNTDMYISFSSAGFGFTGFPKGETPVNYLYQLPSHASSGMWLGFNSGDRVVGGPDDALATEIAWTGQVISVPFKVEWATENVDGTNFYKTKTGEYSDTVTVTLSAKI